MRCIDADALLDEVMDHHCNDCDRRKGIKNGKYRIIYSIGETPCKACDVDDLKGEIKDAPTIEPDPDTVSRQAVLDAIMGEPTDAHYPSWYAEQIKKLPPARPEVIRCKDCKWFGRIGCAISIVDDSDKPTENDFCSFAERRTDESD